MPGVKRRAGMLGSMPRRAFDAAFYRRFYFDPRTQVTSRAETVARARTLAALVEHLDIPVRTILDAGCGLGWMRRPLLLAFPHATYTGIEVSRHVCERYGWTHASLSSYRTRRRFDLVICDDVLQYLTDFEAARAIANIGRLCRGALFLQAPTREDWRRNADRSCSDEDIHLRPTSWYRTRLMRRFRHAGFGLYVRRNIPLLQWELSRAEH
jgi:SAM-dependent methyltransferase